MIEFLNDISAFSVQWSPLLNLTLLYVLGGLACGLLLLSLIRSKKGSAVRVLIAFSFLLVLGNPTLVKEQRKSVKDTAVLVIDKSASQEFGGRLGRTAKAQKYIASSIQTLGNVDLRIVEGGLNDEDLATRTDLFEHIREAFSDVPMSRRAGVVIVTDGQIHDVPNIDILDDEESVEDAFGPVHVLLTGSRDDKDRHLVVEQAPAYGIVGQEVGVTFRIQDTPNIRSNGLARVTIRKSIGDTDTRLFPVGQSITLNLSVDHAGQNVYEVDVETVDGELTDVNNKTAILVNGVRDRLKVLLISGKPHAGERTWRNILTSDPAVDLVHFTILREPHKLNNVPQNELSLIPFPFRELFEVKLYDFDLIIFDRYRANRIMPRYYFGNIAKYVRQGGALLEASGPAFASGQSIFDTALGDVLPSIPTGEVLEQAYKPKVTELGGRHPVTQDLSWPSRPDGWGDWLRQVSVIPKQGNTVMTGVGEKPLLILDRVEQGRVAHLTSDLIWLWARGYDGGGPQADLLRRLAHWLMKEPELEEDSLDVRVNGDDITIRRRSLQAQNAQVIMTLPNGQEQKLQLTSDNEGWAQTTLSATQLGIYKFQDDTLTRVALVGEYNPPELQSVVTTEDVVKGFARLTGGSVKWLVDNGEPFVRYMPENTAYSGFGWIGLRENKDFTVTGVTARSLLPDLSALGLLLLILLFAWWREGKTA